MQAAQRRPSKDRPTKIVMKMTLQLRSSNKVYAGGAEVKADHDDLAHRRQMRHLCRFAAEQRRAKHVGNEESSSPKNLTHRADVKGDSKAVQGRGDVALGERSGKDSLYNK